MKLKHLLILAAFSFSTLSTKAVTPDEGMWLPMLINKNYDEMKKLGFRLTAEDLYAVNNSSMKDAIVSLGFCSGEMISAEGLMLTNHHCGFGSIQFHSSVDHDYLTDGFWAKTKADELYSPEMVASFLVRMEDVTSVIAEATKGMNDSERAAKMKETIKAITDESTKDTHYEAIVRDVFGDNQYLLFVYERFPDVRLVGAPPSSIGKFGGDTDNWMWPRHTGDFSLFRVYMGKDGKPATYSKDNIPYKPKKHLAISTKGIKEGDFAMVMGYPGRTNRYAFSAELQNAVDKVNPALISLLGKRLEIMKADMDKEASVRIKYADTYASLANSWKYYLGQNEGLKKLDVIAVKRSIEAGFEKFAASNATNTDKYAQVLGNVNSLYNDYKPYALRNLYLSLAGNASAAVSYANRYKSLIALYADPVANKETIDQTIADLQSGIDEQFKDYVPETDKKILAALLTMYYTDQPASDRPAVLEEIVKKYKGKSASESFAKYAEEVFKRSLFVSKERAAAFLANPNAKVLLADPIVQLHMKYDEYRKTYSPNVSAFASALAKEKKLYIAGLMEMNAGRLMYPDANSTLRITYGKVSGYSGKDAIEYNYYSTSNGILEKYDPENEEFIVPEKLINLIKKKDFGPYTNEKGELVVNFLSDNDITGGNSGSPVINGNGELIGCAFDGNWEAMTGDLVFDKQYKKTISVDIRYILFIIDKYAGAKHLIEEMTIVK